MAFLPFCHRTHARPTALTEGQGFGGVVAPAYPLARRPVYVHGQTGKAYIARNTKPVPGLQTGTEGTIAGQPVGNHIGAAGGDLVLKVVQGEVAEDGAVEQVAHQIVLGEAGQLRLVVALQGGGGGP